MQPRPDRLDVYYGSDLVGAVHDSAPLAFEYASTWLEGASACRWPPSRCSPAGRPRPRCRPSSRTCCPRRTARLPGRPAQGVHALLAAAGGGGRHRGGLRAGGARADAGTAPLRSHDLGGHRRDPGQAVGFCDRHPRARRPHLPGRRAGQDQPGDLRRRRAAAAQGHFAIDAHPQAQHPPPGQGLALGSERDHRDARRRAGRPADGRGLLRTAHRSLRRAPLRPPASRRRHAGPAGAVRPVPVGRHGVGPQVREGRRPRPGRLRRTDPPLQRAARRRPAPPGALGVLQPVRRQQRQPRQEPVDLQRAWPGRDADAVLRPDVHAAVPGPVARVRLRDRRRGQAGRDGRRASGADGQAAGHATALPGSAGAGHGRPRAHGHRPGHARDRAVADAIGPHAGRAARALRVVHHQEAWQPVSQRRHEVTERAASAGPAAPRHHAAASPPAAPPSAPPVAPPFFLCSTAPR
jgi:hypothetical protein